MSLSKNYPTIRPTLLLDFAADNVLDPRITFTRATPATYYDGVTTAVAEQNLVLYSQTFDNAYWAVQGSTKGTDVTTAPDGTATADSLTETATTGTHQIFPSGAATVVLTTSAVYTWSCFVKPNGRNFASLQLGSYNTSGRYSFAIFDISGGSVTQTGNLGSATYINSSIASAGSGWYRISLTASLNTGTDGYISIGCSNSGTPTKSLFGDPSYLGDGTSGIYIWGAQLEQRSAVTAYTPTTTAPITNYIPVLQTAAAGVARFDHNPVTEQSLGLLIEESRINLLTYSDDLANAAWTKIRSSIVSNTIVAPDGTLTGDKLVENTDNNTHLVTNNASLATATIYTMTAYIKAGGRNWARLLPSSSTPYGGAQYNANFDLVNGVVGTVSAGASATITAVGNGWYRCSLTTGATTTSGSSGIQINSIIDDTTTSYTGNGWDGIYIWGAQLEAGAFATSYIATVATTQTRNTDIASMTGTNFSSWFNNSEGTFYSDSNYVAVPSSDKAVFNASDGTSANSMQIYASNNGQTRFYAATSSAVTVNLTTPVSTIQAGAFIKQAGAYAVNNSVFSYNGAITSVDTVCTIPIVNRLVIASINGTIKKLAYYPARLTDTQLQNLTL